MAIILYINNEHCEDIEELKNYFINKLDSQNIVEEIIEYARNGDLFKWLKEKGEFQLACMIKEIDHRNYTDNEYIKILAKIMTGCQDIDVNKNPYNKYFTIEATEYKYNNEDNVDVLLSFSILKKINEKYKIEIHTNWGTYRTYINLAKYNKGYHSKIRIPIERGSYNTPFGGINKITIDDQNLIEPKLNIKTKHNDVNSCIFINGHEYVDLGLPSGLKWATCNVGADSPEEYGDYFAWGETYTNDEYDVDNCELHDIAMDDFNGNPDYDVATSNWGDDWRMPTQEEFEELLKVCEWMWMKEKDVYGMRVTGPNGNSIFLPAAGFRNKLSLYGAGEDGRYWSSTPSERNNMEAHHLDFIMIDKEYIIDVCCSPYRYHGLSVRPVSG